MFVMTETQQKYRATAMHPSHGDRSVSGIVEVSNDRLAFTADTVSFEMPLEGLKVEAGGHNDEQLFLQHPAQPEWILTTPERGLLQAIFTFADGSLKAQIQTTVRRKPTLGKFYALAGAFVLVIALLIAVLFAMKSQLARLVVNQLPVSWEQQFGDAAFDSMQRDLKIIHDPKWSNQLHAVTSRLVPTITNSAYPFRFYIVESKDLNAFAVPGGHVVVFTGLLKAVKRPEELAGVLAHEIAHVTERHSLRKLVEAAGLVLILQAVVGDATGLIAAAKEGSELLLRQKFSRDFEREADDQGWKYLLAAKIDPRGMIDFFSTMQKELASNPAAAAVEGTLGFLSTHPPTKERIERLEKKWKQVPRETGFAPLAESAK